MANDNPTVTLTGRLSFPKWTAQEAFDFSQTGKFPYDSVDKAKPQVNLLLEASQWDKLREAFEVFLKYIEQRAKDGETKNVLPAEDIADIREGLDKGVWGSKLYQLPIRDVYEKTAEMAPEAVAELVVKGAAGSNLNRKAIVRSEEEVLDPDYVFTKPAILNIDQTVHDLQAGCYVKMTVNFWAYVGVKPGISCGGTTVVFHLDGEPFGGGVGVDEEEMFLDD